MIALYRTPLSAYSVTQLTDTGLIASPGKIRPRKGHPFVMLVIEQLCLLPPYHQSLPRHPRRTLPRTPTGEAYHVLVRLR